MPRGGPHFSTEELVKVLSHYDIGVVHGVQTLAAGNRQAPKVIVTADKGRFLLKRRLRGGDDLDRVAFAHAVQGRLVAESFPVPALLSTCDEHTTVLCMDHHIYEFFRFVNGSRYDGSKQATVDAGRQLGRFHRILEGFGGDAKLLEGGFHDSAVVRRHLRSVGSHKHAGRQKDLLDVTEALRVLYDHACARVDQLGHEDWAKQVIHGDWHPGNMLFSDRRVVAVLDFDVIRIAPRLTDLANGMLQFSIVGGRPNPADWPDYFDQAKLFQFLAGYREVIALDKYRIAALIYLMIETMIAEAVMPVAATGFFGNLSGLDFLKMISRKATWLRKHRRELTDIMRM